MLLRSSSAPILNSWPPHSKDSSSSSSLSELDHSTLHLHRTKSVSSSTPTSISSIISKSNHNPPKPKLLLPHKRGLNAVKQLGVMVTSEARVPQTLELGGGGINGGDGRGGRGSDGGDCSDGSHNSHSSTEAYYLRMIEADPGNALILGNYAKFLKEVRGDYGKAEEYCGRAILANPNDTDALSLYADLIWISQKDSKRAEVYFDQAIKTSPDNCYVLASYARFLWDAEDVEEYNKDDLQNQCGIDQSRSSDQKASTFFHGETLTT